MSQWPYHPTQLSCLRRKEPFSWPALESVAKVKTDIATPEELRHPSGCRAADTLNHCTLISILGPRGSIAGPARSEGKLQIHGSQPRYVDGELGPGGRGSSGSSNKAGGWRHQRQERLLSGTIFCSIARRAEKTRAKEDSTPKKGWWVGAPPGAVDALSFASGHGSRVPRG